MKISGKVIAAIAVVGLLAAAALFGQYNTSKPKKLSLSSQEMEVLVNEVLPPGQQQLLASNPESKKQLVKGLRELLSLAQVAEREGFADKPEVKAQIELQNALALREAYQKKNPDAKVSDEEINAYAQAHPDDFNNFIESNPQLKAQAQGPQTEGLKKEFHQIKVLAERARQEKLDQADGARLRSLIGRSQVLAQAYYRDLQQNSDKLVTDADVEQYYKEHPEEFEEVRARHILISTGPGEEPEDDGHGHTKGQPGAKPKTLTKEEAKKKAESILERIRKGEDFNKLAGEFTDEPGGKEKGGDLGYFAKGAMVPQFQDVAFALKPGEVSNVVETDFGYHIIKVEDRRTKPLDDAEARQEITEKVKAKKLEDRIKEIAENSGVEVAEDFTINPPSNQPPAAIPSGAGAPPPSE